MKMKQEMEKNREREIINEKQRKKLIATTFSLLLIFEFVAIIAIAIYMNKAYLCLEKGGLKWWLEYEWNL